MLLDFCTGDVSAQMDGMRSSIRSLLMLTELQSVWTEGGVALGPY
jgi:hypothetical protein